MPGEGWQRLRFTMFDDPNWHPQWNAFSRNPTPEKPGLQSSAGHQGTGLFELKYNAPAWKGQITRDEALQVDPGALHVAESARLETLLASERCEAPRSPAGETEPKRIHMIEPALTLSEQMDEPKQSEADQRSHLRRLGCG